MIDYGQLDEGLSSGAVDVANVILTTRCNAQCESCAYWRIEPTHLPVEHYRAFVDSVAEQDPAALLLTGGDPLLHPDVHEMLDYAFERDLDVVVNTQGWSLGKLTDEQVARVASFVISLDSHDPDTYFELRKGHLKSVVRAIERIRSVAPDVNITANVLIQKANVDHVEETVRYARDDLGVSSASLLVPSLEPQGFGWEHHDEDPPIPLPDREQLADLEQQFVRLMETEGMEEFISQPPNALSDYLEYLKLLRGEEADLSKRACYVPERTVTLTPYGYLKPCFYLEERMEWSPTEDPLGVDEREAFLERYEHDQPSTCETCVQFACNEDLRPVVQWTKEVAQ